MRSDLPLEEQQALRPPSVAISREVPTNGHALSGTILLFADPAACGKELAWFRRYPKTALLPLFVALTSGATEAPAWADAADHLSRASDFPWHSMGVMAERILTSVRALDGLEGAYLSPEARLITFLASRGDKTLLPSPAAAAMRGFCYPLARVFLDVGVEGDEVECLERLAASGLLAREPHEEIICCPRCGGARLNLRKACGECGGTLIEAEPLIHHYPCGAVFREQETRRGDGEYCPKCGKRLVHIGVDFDRPTEVDLCSACGSVSEYFPLQALCFECGHRFLHAEGARTPVHRYRLADGYPAAAAPVVGRTDGPRVVDPASFRALLAAYTGPGAAVSDAARPAVLRITTERPMSRIAEDLLLLELFDCIRSTDVVSRATEASYVVLLHDAGPEQAAYLAARVRQRLSRRVSGVVPSLDVERVVDQPRQVAS